MRIEYVDDTEDQGPELTFPPKENYLDLHENPHAVDRIAAARRYLPLRNFLTVLNGAESLFATVGATTKSDSPAAVSAGGNHEFASETSLVFAEPSFNFERERFVKIRSGLKELLEREKGDAVRAVLRISVCDFPARKRCGFCLVIRLVAQGDSAQQAELRWGLGLARVQQALLFRARTLKGNVAK
jgi:hypothetical protein